MTNLSVKLNVILAIAVAILGGMLFIGDPPREEASIPRVSHAPAPMPPSSPPADSSIAIEARLSMIDTRLAEIERALAASPAVTQSPAPAASIDPEAAAAADRRVEAMFPDGRFDHADLVRFRASLGELPKDQQIALAAAFSRAVNGERLQSRM